METENKEIDMDELGKNSKMNVKAKSFDVWKCMSCEGEPEFERAEAMKRMQEVHGIDTKTAKGSRKMLMHLDGRDWYQSNYEITINGLVFVNYCRNVRAKNDMMRFA